MLLNEFLMYCVPDDLPIHIIVNIPETDFIGYKDEYFDVYGHEDDYRNLFMKSVDIDIGGNTLVIYAEV